LKRLTYYALRAFSALQRTLRERLTSAGWLALGATASAAGVGIDTTRTMSYQASAFLFALLAIAFLLPFTLARRRLVPARVLATAGLM